MGMEIFVFCAEMIGRVMEFKISGCKFVWLKIWKFKIPFLVLIPKKSGAIESLEKTIRRRKVASKFRRDMLDEELLWLEDVL